MFLTHLKCESKLICEKLFLTSVFRYIVIGCGDFYSVIRRGDLYIAVGCFDLYVAIGCGDQYTYGRIW